MSEIKTGDRYRYRVPPKDTVTVTGVDEYGVSYVGRHARASMTRSLFLDMFEPVPDDDERRDPR